MDSIYKVLFKKKITCEYHTLALIAFITKRPTYCEETIKKKKKSNKEIKQIRKN